MGENYAIEVKNVSKSFKNRPQRTIKDSLMNIGSKKPPAKKILDDISFSVKKGDGLGIIGTNGAGKSTLLKIVVGVMEPDSGTVQKNGRIASLLELGTGFHIDLSGRENIYIKASTFGFSKKEVDSRIDKIIEFAELGEYIDEPLRTYSSGMNARLAFAISINVDADIIIADEIFSVGDLSFRDKCINIFRKMRRAGATIIVVSHGMGIIRDMCDTVIWIRDGKIYDYGNCKKVCDHYESEEGESFKAMLRAAEEGNDRAQNTLAVMYRDGKNTDVDYKEALGWFRSSAEQSNREAQRNLADMILKGLGTEQDPKEALEWFLRSAEAGDASAVVRVANIYRSGIGVDVNHREAFRWFKESAELGNAGSQLILAEMLMDGYGTEADSEAALKWYLKSAESGNSNARYKLGTMYRDGNGADRDLKEAINCFNIAASQSNIEAQVALMDMLSFSDIDQSQITNFKEELNLAAEQLTSLAEKGSAVAQRNIAGRLLNGVGVNQDSVNALKWYTKAASAGDVLAMYQTGIMYRLGIGTDVDKPEAIKWFNMAAEQKNTGAISEIAWMLLSGEETEKNDSLAFEYFKVVADMGNAGVRNQIGMMYRDGIGITKDLEEAKKYFLLSAEQGNAAARMNLAEILKQGTENDQIVAFELYKKLAFIGDMRAYFHLGIMHRDGIGTASNISQAIFWLEKASKKGDQKASNELRKIINKP